MSEKILCSAIWYNDGVWRNNLPRNIGTGVVVCGWRHANCVSQLCYFLYPDFETNPEHDEKRIHVIQNQVQGFLTSKGRFVDRVEALEIHNSDISKPEVLGQLLYSEDLY